MVVSYLSILEKPKSEKIVSSGSNEVKADISGEPGLRLSICP
jgi:hypothetical protein